MKKVKLFFFISTICLFSTSTTSNQESAQFHIKVNIIETCEIATETIADMDFGTVVRSTSNIQSTGSLNVSCTNGTAYNIALNSTGSLKNVSNTSLVIPYKLYQDAALSKEWGNMSNTSLSQKGTGTTQNIKIWGKIPDTNLPAGQYTDQVTAVITY